ncbi:MAG: peptide chain release factor N(5)-glutamine methyltransferase [Alphaproteobacteria bacterium]|nr:peptide chain release factor N(5)-glutamine methyltransferase [Alphaproteobacteria bacterium]
MIQNEAFDAAETVGEIVRAAARRLARAGIDSSQLEARVIVAHGLTGDLAGGLDGRLDGGPERLIADRDEALNQTQIDRIAHVLARRERREPLAQIFGHKEFWSLSFAVSRDVLTPRPESETVVETVQRLVRPKSGLRILDLGTGSGCLLLSLLTQMPESTGVGIDVDRRAIDIARRNARDLGLASRAAFCVGDWAASLDHGFDVVVSNPPYIETEQIARLMPEVGLYEPIRALDGGRDGLQAYRSIIPELWRLLGPAGVAAIEIGAGQADAVAAIATQEKLASLAIVEDLAGIERCLAFCKSATVGVN